MTEQINLLPKRGFKEFQNTQAWEQRKVGEFYNFKNGLNKEKKYFGRGVPIVNFTDVFRNRGLHANELNGKVDLSDKEIANFEVKQGDIFFTRTSETIDEIGYPSVMLDVPTNTVFSGFVLRGRAIAEDPLDNNFKRYVFFTKQFREEMKKKSSMTTRALTSGTAIKEMCFEFPKSKEEQAKIGTFFANLDHLITLHQRKLEKTKALKSAYISEMFPAEGESEPKRRFAGFTQAWELRKLGDVIDGLYNGQTPSRFRDDFWNGNINWLSSGELNRSIVKSASEKITEAGQADANLRIVPKNTFVMAITGLEATGTRGNCGILGIDTTLNQSCMAVFPNKKMLSTQFLFQWYKMVGEDYGIRFTQGTKQQSYNAEIIKDLDICLPKVEEQLKIGQFLSEMDNLINLQQSKLEKLQNIKKAYLNEMFV